MTAVIAALAGTIFSGIGLWLLYSAWRDRKAPRGARTWIGWGFLILSLSVWSYASGSDRGLALGVTVLMLAAVGLIAMTGQWRSRKPHREPRLPRTENAPAMGGVSRALAGRGLMIVLVAGPLAAIASCLLTFLFFAHGPWTEASRAMTAFLLMTLFWAMAIVWVCYEDNLLRPAATFATLSGAAVALLFFGS